MKRKTVISLTLLLGVSFLVYSCNTYGQQKGNSNLEEAKKAIAESNVIYMQAFTKNDSSIFLGRYAKDACLMPPNSPISCGREALLGFFKSAYNDFGIRNGKFTTTAVYGDGIEYVTEEGTGLSFDANGKVIDDGKYLVLWKKTPEGWKMFKDSFSSNKQVPK